LSLNYDKKCITFYFLGWLLIQTLAFYCNLPAGPIFSSGRVQSSDRMTLLRFMMRDACIYIPCIPLHCSGVGCKQSNRMNPGEHGRSSSTRAEQLEVIVQQGVQVEQDEREDELVGLGGQDG
jgi:hypothetical protein